MQGCPMCARMSNKRELRGLCTKVDINHYGQAGNTQFLPLLDEIKVLTLLTFSKIGKRHTHQLNLTHALTDPNCVNYTAAWTCTGYHILRMPSTYSDNHAICIHILFLFLFLIQQSKVSRLNFNAEIQSMNNKNSESPRICHHKSGKIANNWVPGRGPSG